MPRYTSRNEKFTFGVGVSAVYVNDNAPNLTLTTGSTTTTAITTMSSRGEGLNITPEIKIGFKPTEHFSIEGRSNRFNTGITTRYTF